MTREDIKKLLTLIPETDEECADIQPLIDTTDRLDEPQLAEVEEIILTYVNTMKSALETYKNDLAMTARMRASLRARAQTMVEETERADDISTGHDVLERTFP